MQTITIDPYTETITSDGATIDPDTIYSAWVTTDGAVIVMDRTDGTGDAVLTAAIAEDGGTLDDAADILNGAGFEIVHTRIVGTVDQPDPWTPNSEGWSATVIAVRPVPVTAERA